MRTPLHFPSSGYDLTQEQLAQPIDWNSRISSLIDYTRLDSSRQFDLSTIGQSSFAVMK